MSRHRKRGFTLIELLVGIAIDRMAFEAEQQILQSPHLTDKLVRQFLSEHSKLQPLPRMGDAIDVGERYMGLDAVQFVARNGAGSVGKALKMIEALSGAPIGEQHLVSIPFDEVPNKQADK